MDEHATLVWIAELTGARTAQRGAQIQSLWSGYGTLFRVMLEGAGSPSVVVKHISPRQRSRAPTDARSHARKVRSYEVETTFYRDHAPRCDDTCRVARCLGEREVEGERWLVLEDLDAAGYRGRARHLDDLRLHLCLAWLAAFHAKFLGCDPVGLWTEGSYWHLATRPDELTRMNDAALRAKAPELDARLANARFRTFVHGDAKPANFCFDGDMRAAAVDFQYVGGGCGMRDLAYLLEGLGPRAEARARDAYFERLREVLVVERAPVDCEALEREWRDLYPVAALDFRRFLAGWLP